MSWLFGNKNPPQDLPFDSTAPERVASELENSTTMEKEAELGHKHDMRRIEAKMRGEAKIEQENWDTKEKIEMTTADESQVSGSGMTKFLNDWKIVIAFASVGIVAGAYRGVKGNLGFFSFLKDNLGKPSLVRETSRITVGSAVIHPIKTIAQLIKRPEDPMKGIILKPTLEEKLRGIAITTRDTKKNAGYYTNILLHGPPGTGKSMFAKRLAKHSGMHYAILNGGDVALMGKEGATAMHKVFDWAQDNRKGVVVFVDHADAFLRKRNTDIISEDMRAALNTFLYRTGDQSDKFMVVLASCHPEQFDWALNNRLDEMVKFEIPSYEERERLVRHYFEKFILEPAASKSGRLCIAEFDHGKKWAEIAEKTEGLTGREISKLGVAWQAKAYASKDGVLTEKMINDIVNNAVQQHKEKVEWQLRQAVSSREMPTITAPDTAASKEPVTPTTVQQPSRDIST